jgi:glycerol kinase
MNCVLALDQSTSATKALLFEADGRLVDKVSRDHRQSYPQPGWVEHDAEEIWRNVLETARALLDRHRNRIPDLACLSLTNQRETIVAFDRATGRPVHPAIVWQCRRGDAICRELIEAGHEPRVTSLTGLRLDTYFSGSKAAWLAREQPELRSKLAGGEVLLGTIDAYLVYRLTGGRVFAIRGCATVSECRLAPCPRFGRADRSLARQRWTAGCRSRCRSGA